MRWSHGNIVFAGLNVQKRERDSIEAALRRCGADIMVMSEPWGKARGLSVRRYDVVVRVNVAGVVCEGVATVVSEKVQFTAAGEENDPRIVEIQCRRMMGVDWTISAVSGPQAGSGGTEKA